jgi:hypothetical protein
LKTKQSPVLIASYSTGIYQGFEKSGRIIGSAFTGDGYRLAAFNKRSNSGQEPLTDLYVSKNAQ